MNVRDPQLLTGATEEPRNLRQWPTSEGHLYSCGRPGRGENGRSKRKVSEPTLRLWLDNLPASELQIVSLLGWKPDRQDNQGHSEFTYYPFRSCTDCSDGRPTFQAWLTAEGRCHTVHEFPTIDLRPLTPETTASQAVRHVRELLHSGLTVLVVDSGGVERTGELCRRVLSRI